MKTGLSIAFVLIVVVGFVKHQQQKFDSKKDSEQQWLVAAKAIASDKEKITARSFLNRKHLKIIGIADVPRYHHDTLYLRFVFEKDDCSFNYVNGVLIISKGAMEFSDNGKAITLMYGIARHLLQSDTTSYPSFAEKMEVDKARADQYLCDVLLAFAPKNYNELLKDEASRQYDVYMNTGYYVPDTVDKVEVFNYPMTECETIYMDVLFQKSAAFLNCESVFSNESEIHLCKTKASDLVHRSNYSIDVF